LRGLYNFYDKLTIVGDINLCSSQLFFDLNYNAKDVFVNCYEEEAFADFLEEVFEEVDVNLETYKDMHAEIRNQMKYYHTPFHRAATLCEYLKDQDAAKQVEGAKSQVSMILKDK
jgi:hypothetical protein